MTLIPTSDVMNSENCTKRTVQKWCKANKVKVIGGMYFLSQEEVEAFRTRKRAGWRKGKLRKILS